MNNSTKLVLGLILAGGFGFTAYTFLFPGGVGPTVIDNQNDVDPGNGQGDEPKPNEINSSNPARVEKKDPGPGDTRRTRIDGPVVDAADCEQGIIGRLVNSQGGPVVDAEVYLMPSMTGVDTMRMFRQFQEGVMFPPVATAKTGGDGTFTLGLMHWKEDGKYEVRVVHPEYCDQRLPNIAPQPNDWWDCGNVSMKTGVAVFGRVTTETGLPVANATVAVIDASGMLNFAPTPGREKGLSAKTDDSGNYEIRNIDPVGVFSMNAVAENFAKDEKTELQLAGSLRHKIDFRLSPGLDIAGVVVDPKGKPVEGATVTVSALSQKSRVMEKTSTDPEGYFIVSGIKAGPYAVMIEAKGFQKIDDKPFQAGDTDLEFTFETQGRVHVTVLNKHGRPMSNYHVNIKAAFEGQEMYGNALVSQPVRGAKDGTVMIGGLNPLTYVAEIYAKDHAKNFSTRFTIVENQAEPPRVTVNMNAGGTIVGTVTDRKGKPVPGVTITTRPSGMIDNPFLAIFQIPYTITKRTGKTNKKGRFRFALLNPGKYQLKITSDDYCAIYVQNIQVELNQVSEHHGIKITRGCSVSGITKVNGKPTGQVKVSISSVTTKSNSTPFSAEAVSDNEGRFLLNKRLKPGKYKVMAAEQVQSNPLLMMVQFSKSSQEIVIPLGSEHRVIDVNINKIDEGK